MRLGASNRTGGKFYNSRNLVLTPPSLCGCKNDRHTVLLYVSIQWKSGVSQHIALVDTQPQAGQKDNDRNRKSNSLIFMPAGLLHGVSGGDTKACACNPPKYHRSSYEAYQFQRPESQTLKQIPGKDFQGENRSQKGNAHKRPAFFTKCFPLHKDEPYSCQHTHKNADSHARMSVPEGIRRKELSRANPLWHNGLQRKVQFSKFVQKQIPGKSVQSRQKEQTSQDHRQPCP